MEVISSFQATCEAWKSIEWASWLVAGFTRWTRIVSPTRTRITGPGTVPLSAVVPKVHTPTTKPPVSPLATVIVFSWMISSMSWAVPSMSGGASAGYRT